jgi:hypothetical protein
VGALPELSAPDDLTLFVGEPLREQQSSSSVEPEREPAADLVRDQRIALLVRKHEGSNEDRARFEILTQRLRKLYPRVTQDDYKTMSEMVTDAESTAAVLAGVRAKFGLR